MWVQGSTVECFRYYNYKLGCPRSEDNICELRLVLHEHEYIAKQINHYVEMDLQGS
jgi:hypothetical protein